MLINAHHKFPEFKAMKLKKKIFFCVWKLHEMEKNSQTYGLWTQTEVLIISSAVTVIRSVCSYTELSPERSSIPQFCSARPSGTGLKHETERETWNFSDNGALLRYKREKS